jgi:hypothetical protein
MNLQQFQNSIGYPCIFSRTTDEAADNLVRLITRQECGYVEGTAQWIAALRLWLEPGVDLLRLNFCGARFSADQWRTILTRVLLALEN